MKKTVVGAAICAGTVIALSGGSVLANHDDWSHGQTEMGNGVSICVFSGLNDDPDDPEEGGRVQSYGQAVRALGVEHLKEEGETPANLCNPNHAPWGKDGVWWRSVPNNGK